MMPDPVGEDSDALLYAALANSSFRLVYQPIVSFRGGTTECYAVLLRLIDKNDREYFPSEFIQQANKIGSSINMDRWTIAEAIKTLAEQRNKGHLISFFVSISADGIEDQGLLPWIIRHLRQHGIKGSWITFQFRSKDAKQHLESLKTLSMGLKQIHCRILIDHFNGVADEAALLHVLPIDFVKFGPEFMADLANNPSRQDQLYRLQKNLKSKHLNTIASAVEDQENLGILWNMGVSAIQGYFCHPPVSQLGPNLGESQGNS